MHPMQDKTDFELSTLPALVPVLRSVTHSCFWCMPNRLLTRWLYVSSYYAVQMMFFCSHDFKLPSLLQLMIDCFQKGESINLAFSFTCLFCFVSVLSWILSLGKMYDLILLYGCAIDISIMLMLCFRGFFLHSCAHLFVYGIHWWNSHKMLCQLASQCCLSLNGQIEAIDFC